MRFGFLGSRGRVGAWTGVATLVLCGGLMAEEPVDYLKQVKPLLAERCLSCHGPLQQSAGLRLDTAALIRKGGRGGPAVRPGDISGSALLRRVAAPKGAGRMPPDGEALKPEEIALLTNWVRQNAPAPRDERPQTDPRDHWSFRAVVRPKVPKSGGRQVSGWARNPIDAFLAARYERDGLRPQPPASRPEQIRRLYLDLIGLPPSPEELDRLAGDVAPGWYERLADRLLADPRYGERWGRHWMDIWRYSDWWGLGQQLRNSQEHIWQWRDWIIESLNADMPYDEMVRLMLAVDELHPNDPNKLRAGGYLARNYFLFNRNQWMDETVEHVGKAFLGLTVNCSKCHDHKYDPIRQSDYYQMRAFFEPYHVRMDVAPGEADLAVNGIPRAFDANLDAPTYLFIRGQESRPDTSRRLVPGVPAVLAFKPLDVRPVELPVEAWQPERRPWVADAHLAAARKAVATAESGVDRASSGDEPARRAAELALDAARADLTRVERTLAFLRLEWANTNATPPSDARRAAVLAERAAGLARARLAVFDAERRAAGSEKKPMQEKALADARAALKKAVDLASAPIGDKDRPSPLVGARWTATRFLFSGKDDPDLAFPPKSTGRRTALAGWITDRRNPLTARVAVNHLWNRHMGTPLVSTVFDFGRKGAAPTHPELLDWLASEFMDGGWSMKRIHRLIVTSAAYRMSSSEKGAEANLRKDRDNLAFWRRSPIRLEAEAVRDSMLSLAGTLDPSRGGPPVPEAQQEASRRRSLYFFHSDISSNLFLSTFDAAAVKECYRRDQSIVPQQALALTNSALALDTAPAIAARLTRSGSVEDDAFIQRAFLVILGIHASDAELAASRRAMASWRKGRDAAPASASPSVSTESARTHLVWVLLNHNDFVTLR